MTHLLFRIYLISLFLLAILPINGVSSPLNNTYVVHLRLDYLAHGIVFVPWMAIASRGVKFKNPEGWVWRFLVLLLAGIVYAALCELVQLPLAYRTFNVNDMIGNVAGVVAGVVFTTRKLLTVKASGSKF